MSSTALTLVKRVARMTGDFNPDQITTIIGSAGGLSERIIDMINQTIGDVEEVVNWPVLRSDSKGVSNGIDDTFVFTGTEDVRVGGPVSVWIEGHQALQELTPDQFDSLVASNAYTGLPEYFQRGVAASGKVQVQVYPAPANNQIIHMSSYRRALRLDAANDLSTTEFDDDVLVYGALMHLDLYDGLNRNYAVLYKNHLDRKILSTMSNRAFGVVVDDYR